MAINIFEPSLQVRHPLLDYEKLQIQGTFPRPHEIPTDVFPTYSVIAGVHVDRPVGKVATFTEDNRLRVESSGGSASDPSASMHPNCVYSTSSGMSSDSSIILDLPVTIDIIYQLTWGFALNGSAVATPGPSSDLKIVAYNPSRGTNLLNIPLPTSLSIGDRFSVQNDTIVYSGGMDLRNIRTDISYNQIAIVMNLIPAIVNVTLLFWSSEGSIP